MQWWLLNMSYQSLAWLGNQSLPLSLPPSLSQLSPSFPSQQGLLGWVVLPLPNWILPASPHSWWLGPRGLSGVMSLSIE